MKIIIIGSGLIGVTTAYFLARRGHEVTVVDRRQGAGRETSFANGGLLTPSMPEPWNSPGSWRVLLGSVGRSDAALQLRLRALPSLAMWGIRFLRNSTAAAFERNTLNNLRLSLYSLQEMENLRRDAAIDYGRAAPGSLRIFRDCGALDRVAATAQWLSRAGLIFRRLSVAEAVELEPTLAPIAGQLVGALHYGVDEVGDAHQFCIALAEQLRQKGVEFAFGATVTALEVRSGHVTGVLSDGKRFAADSYIVAAGSYSTPLLRAIGVYLPVRPAKGYSVTLDGPFRNHAPPRVPIVDDLLHAVIVPLNGAIRVAGTAEFAGYDLTLPPARIRNLLHLLKGVLPQTRFEPSAARAWCGLRAMSADGVPIIDRTPISNLFVNTGHGHLGWTMAAGSARLLTDLLCGDAPAIDPSPYRLNRFAPARRGTPGEEAC